MPFDKKAYDQQYMKENMVRKQIVFNRNNPADVRLLEHVQSQGSANAYIKELISKDIDRKERK